MLHLAVEAQAVEAQVVAQAVVEVLAVADLMAKTTTTRFSLLMMVREQLFPIIRHRFVGNFFPDLKTNGENLFRELNSLNILVLRVFAKVILIMIYGVAKTKTGNLNM